MKVSSNVSPYSVKQASSETFNNVPRARDTALERMLRCYAASSSESKEVGSEAIMLGVLVSGVSYAACK
jgi:hypothetical protein